MRHKGKGSSLGAANQSTDGANAFLLKWSPNGGRKAFAVYKRLIFAIALAVAATIALSVHVSLSGSSWEEKLKVVLPVEGGQGVLAILLGMWFWHVREAAKGIFSRKGRAPLGLSILLAFCLVIGRSLNEYGSLKFVTSDQFYIVLSLVSFLGFTALVAPVFFLAFQWLDSHECKSRILTSGSEWWRTFGLSFGVIVLLWLPYIVVGFPGTTSVDFIQQLRQFYGATEITNHHPYLMTLLFGFLFRVGLFFGGTSNFGLLTVSLWQTIAMAATFACSTAWIMRIGCKKRIICLIVFFYGLCPIFPMYAQWCVKDTLSAVLLINFIIQVSLKLHYRKSSYSNVYFSWPAIVLVGVLCALSRNNCAYVVIPTLVMLMVVFRGGGVASIVSTLLTVFLVGGWSAVLLPVIGVQSGSVSEALSLPLLQTTRCIDIRSDLLTNEEKSALQKPCTVPIEELPSFYSIQISDQVKARYRFDRAELADYCKTYVALGLRFPDVYVSVALAKTFGYWYPAATDKYARFWYEYAPYTTSIMSPSLEKDLMNDEADFSEVIYGIHSVFPEAKTDMRQVILDAANTPVAMLLFSPAFYIWICLTLCVYFVSRRKSFAPLLLPVLLMGAICCISPLNGSIRYALPLICLSPILVGLTFSAEQNEIKGDDDFA